MSPDPDTLIRLDHLEEQILHLTAVIHGDSKIGYDGILATLRSAQAAILENQIAIRKINTERNQERATATAIKKAGEEQLQKLLTTGKLLGLLLTLIQLATLLLAALTFYLRNIP